MYDFSKSLGKNIELPVHVIMMIVRFSCLNSLMSRDKKKTKRFTTDKITFNPENNSSLKSLVMVSEQIHN